MSEKRGYSRISSDLEASLPADVSSFVALPQNFQDALPSYGAHQQGVVYPQGQYAPQIIVIHQEQPIANGMLWFVGGFFCCCLWIVGSCAGGETKVDKVWRNANRIALGMYAVILAGYVILLIAAQANGSYSSSYGSYGPTYSSSGSGGSTSGY